ncbi:MAG: ABC transporter substrate-binding protein [bacterium]|nr:ABC transporter substrate-binding protein [bacterium]
MRRREFITLLGGVAWPSATFAQALPKPPVVAVLLIGTPGYATFAGGLEQGMKELGYVDGRDFELVYRYANGDSSRMPILVNELLPYKPAVFVSGASAAMLAVRQATASIPFVNPSIINDPDGFGMIASQRRPGGQVTGILYSMESLVRKQLELLMKMLPGISRIGGLYNASSPSSVIHRSDAEAAARAVGISHVPVEVRLPADIDGALSTFAAARVEAVFLPGDALIQSERKRIAILAAAAHLPTMSTWREPVYDGCLMSYGINLFESWRRAATFVHKILRGEKPGDIPLEFPTRLDLIINLRTARTLGLTVPPTLLAQADEVIE